MSEDKMDTRYLYQTLLSAKVFCEDVRNYRYQTLLTRELDNLEPMLDEALLLLNDQPSHWVKREKGEA